jgi:spore coat polysaccharide biosynthesis protein SpsF
MRALRGVPAEVYALLTDAKSLDVLRGLAEPEGFVADAGPDEDVLARYCEACRVRDVQRVIRATGDNPVTSARLARDIMALHERAHADLSHYLGCPWGSGVEVVEAEALFAAEREASQADEREHITTFLYRHRERFALLEPQAPTDAFLPEARVTVDTLQDYQRTIRLFEELYHGAPIEIEALVEWSRKNPEVIDAG